MKKWSIWGEECLVLLAVWCVYACVRYIGLREGSPVSRLSCPEIPVSRGRTLNKDSIDEVPDGAMATPALSCMGRVCQEGAMVTLKRPAETCEIPAAEKEEEGNCLP